MYLFGTKSKAQLATCHIDLVNIHQLAITRTKVDYGIHQGSRTVQQQQEYFNNKKSKINPKIYSSIQDLAKVAKHIIIADHHEYRKSRATDLHVAEKYKGRALTWDQIHLSYIAGILMSCAQELYDIGENTHLLRWGGDWDSDGIIGLDHTLRDLPHFELIKP